MECSQKKGVHKCVKSFEKRLVQIALGKWKDKVNSVNEENLFLLLEVHKLLLFLKPSCLSNAVILRKGVGKHALCLLRHRSGCVFKLSFLSLIHGIELPDLLVQDLKFVSHLVLVMLQLLFDNHSLSFLPLFESSLLH